MTLVPTMHLRFVKRRVGANTVRILQQQWRHDFATELEPGKAPIEWRDVEMADEKATQRKFPSAGG